MDFELSVCAYEHYVIVTVGGECDASNAPCLRESLLTALDQQSARIVVDLSGLYFLDCAGATALAAAARRATLLGGAVLLAAPGPIVIRLLRVMGLSKRLRWYPALGSAVAAAESPAAVRHLRSA